MTGLSPRLLVRPPHLRNESLRGYVSRVSDSNGSSPLLKPTLATFGATTSALHEIAILTGSNQSVLESHCSLKFDEHGKSPQVIFGDALMATSQVWMLRRMLCPVCFSVSGISQCCWELCEYDVCHVHGCYMVSRCHACNRPLQWACASKNRCACGVHFTELETTVAPRARTSRCRMLAKAASATLYRPNHWEKITGAITPLDWFFLLENFVRNVLIPGFCERYERTADAKYAESETLVVGMLRDEEYCRYLRQIIFLHAAIDPMTMAQTLRSNNTPEEMKEHFWPCLNDIIFHDVLFRLPWVRGKRRCWETIQPRRNRPPSHKALLRRVQDFFPIDFALEEVE